jgi:hypothetical protein
MENQYVEKYDEGYWVAGTRVSLDSVILAFLEGLSVAFERPRVVYRERAEP